MMHKVYTSINTKDIDKNKKTFYKNGINKDFLLRTLPSVIAYFVI